MNRPWYPFYVGDYTRKTAHLSLLEHGAYRLLIDHYMATGHPLPTDPSKLYRICHARSPSERKAVLSVVAEFFVEDGTMMRHNKCDSELTKQLNHSESQRANAYVRHSRGNAKDMPARASTTTTTTKTFNNGYSGSKDDESTLSVEEQDLRRAKMIAWHRSRNLPTTALGPSDYDWLTKYESKNGAIDA